MTWKTRTRRITGRVIVWAVAFGGGLYVADAMMTSRSIADDGAMATWPTTRPAARPPTRPTSRPALAADVQRVVDRIGAAYAHLPLALDGELVTDFDVAGLKEAKTLTFVSACRSADTFRHEAKDELLVVANHDAVNVYDPKSKQYLAATRPSDTATPSSVAAQALDLVRQQNPALCIAITGDAADVLVPAGSTATVGSSETEGGRPLALLEATDGDRTHRQIWTDAATGRVVRIDYDFADLLRSQGAADVKRAAVSIRYAPEAVPPVANDAAFAFVPPAGATEARPPAPGEMLAGSEPSVLEGKPAPAFTLLSADGRSVSSAEASGQVVVLDFWATWCPPCRRGLPHLAETAKKYADQGVRALAINEREDAGTVRKFMGDQKLALEALLDTDGAVGDSYLVGGIPQTVIIGRDGNVTKVLVGFDDDGAEALDAAVRAALAAPH